MSSMFIGVKNKKVKIWGSILILGLATIGFFVFRGESGPNYEFMVVKRGELVQEVSITGKVRPARSVNLQFESSGRIAAINYKAGDSVGAGTVIASLNNQEAEAQVLEKEAALESVKADLEKSRKNLASLTDPAVSTSLRTELENAQTNLANIKDKADDDLAAEYNNALNVMNEGMTQANSSFIVFKNIRKTYYDTTSSEDGRKVQESEKSAEDALYGISSFNFLGADDYVAAANTSGTNESIDTALAKLQSALSKLRDAYSVLQSVIQSNPGLVSTTDRDKVNTEANNVSSELSGIVTTIQDISSQEIANAKAVSDAEQALAKTRSAFPTAEDILQKEAAVKQAQATLLSVRSQLRKTIIAAPFTGVIARIDGETGETVASADIVASMISVTGYQVEANITEIDISKVKIGDPARLTLDAYGPGVVFEAVVSGIDPGETVIEGVTTYKTSIDLLNADSRLRPNMTANVDIQTNRKDNVISVPQRAVITRNGDKMVRLDAGRGLFEVKVQTGITGRNGYIEITGGLNDGDRVITFIND